MSSGTGHLPNNIIKELKMLKHFTFIIGLTLSLALNASCKVVSDTVTDQESGNALSGVRVTVGGKQDITDANGHYSVVSVPTGRQTIVAALNNYNSSSLVINNLTATITGQNLSLLGVSKRLALAPLAARRDTGMLCLDGCKRKSVVADDSAWDLPRAGAADISEHDEHYCVLAAVKMINHYHGGNITRDEVGFHIAQTLGLGAPEEDIRHRKGHTLTQAKDALTWALSGHAVTQIDPLPTSLQIKQWLTIIRHWLGRLSGVVEVHT